MAQRAILTNDLAVLRLVLVIVAAEAAGSVDVTDVIRIGTPFHVHGRKNIARPRLLGTGDSGGETLPR